MGKSKDVQPNANVAFVVGGGPAGVALACNLARKMHVTLVESNDAIGGTPLRGHTPGASRNRILGEMQRSLEMVAGRVTVITGVRVSENLLRRLPPYTLIADATGANVEKTLGLKREAELYANHSFLEHGAVRQHIVDLHTQAEKEGNPLVWDTMPEKMLGQERYVLVLQQAGLLHASSQEIHKFWVSWFGKVVIPGKGIAASETAKFFAAWNVYQGLRMLGYTGIPSPTDMMDAPSINGIKQVLAECGFHSFAQFQRAAKQHGMHITGPLILLTNGTKNSSLDWFAQGLANLPQTEESLIRIIKATHIAGVRQDNRGEVATVQLEDTVGGLHVVLPTHLVVPTLGATPKPLFPELHPHADSQLRVVIGAAKHGHGVPVSVIQENVRGEVPDILDNLRRISPIGKAGMNAVRRFEENLSRRLGRVNNTA